MSADRLRIARHEAGHAIVAHLEGFKVDSLELDADGGRVLHDGPGDLLEVGEHPIIVATKCALVAVAGGAVSDVPMSGSDNADLARALWLGDFDQGYFYAYRDCLVARARKRLATHWDKLERVASALVERGRLSASEFEALLK